MRILILHLSDLHISSNTDPVLSKAGAIVDAVKNLDYELDLCAIVLSGDIAYSGKEAEYMMAIDFISDLNSLLEASLSSAVPNHKVPIKIVAIPGNHDCDLSGPQLVRAKIIDGVLHDHEQAGQSEIVDLCTNVQQHFFAFLGLISSDDPVKTVSGAHRNLYYEQEFSVEGEKVTFLCLNTAWLSGIPEKQSKLFFPPDIIPIQRNETLTVALMHHSYNWLAADAAREFRHKMEKVSDLILTGHEHVSDYEMRDSGTGHNYLWMEGGALQEPTRTESDFNVLVVDTKQQRQKFAHLKWVDHRYVLAPGTLEGGEGSGLRWEEFTANRIRTTGAIKLSPEWGKNFLEDPELNLTHRSRTKVSLFDIYVFPDFWQIDYWSDDLNRMVRGEEILDWVSSKQRLLILGDDKSGKTSLAKVVYQRMLQRGYVPIWLDGANINPPVGDKLFGWLEETFKGQYVPDGLQTYLQLDKSSRAIIVDDYDQLKLSGRLKKKFVSQLTRFADYVILFANNLLVDLDELTKGDGETTRVSFTHLYIQPFGHLKREMMIQKWVQLNEDWEDTEDTRASFAKSVVNIATTLDTIIGRNFVPSYPVYLLSIIQAAESMTSLNTSASTQGYFYELLIRNALASGRKEQEFDVIVGYLSHLAYRFLTTSTTKISEEELRQFEEEFVQRIDVKLSFNRMRSALDRQQILVKNGERYGFRYPYVFYYFAAMYIRDHLRDLEVWSQVRQMANKLYIERNANIMLFLAHLSKDDRVIEELVNTAIAKFPDLKPADLHEDIEFLYRLGLNAIEVTYEEKDVRESRQEMLAEMDKFEKPVGQAESQDDLTSATSVVDPANPLSKINEAYKTLEILGQLLKNFPASLEGPVKLQIAQTCYGVAMRTLTSIFNLIRGNQQDLLESILAEFERVHPEYNRTESLTRARETVIGITYAVSYGIIKKLSRALGSPFLGPTYDRLLADVQATPAQLLHASLGLDNATGFPSDEVVDLAREYIDRAFPLSLLRLMVVQHLYMFDVEYSTKQKACQALDIPYAHFQMTNPGRKMLTRPGRRS